MSDHTFGVPCDERTRTGCPADSRQIRQGTAGTPCDEKSCTGGPAEEGRKSNRVLLVIAYDGTEYSGFAAQKDPGIRTIEGELNRALSELTGVPITVCGASRTDAGVHALCNYAVFDTDSPIPPEKFAAAVNPHLPDDIRVRKSCEVDPAFHPRNLRTEKTYEYRLYCSSIPDPLRARYFAWTYAALDVDKMRRAAAYLVGEHDFASFANPAGSTATTVREISSIEIEEHRCTPPDILQEMGKHRCLSADLLNKAENCVQQADDAADLAADGISDVCKGARGRQAGHCERSLEDREIILRVSGKGFLYNMVRIIAGTLIRVGRGMTDPDSMPQILEKKDRQAAGDTAPACGLCLVNYRILGRKE